MGMTANAQSPRKGRYKHLDDVGAAAYVTNPDTVKTLVDEVFNFPSYIKLPPGVDAVVKSRLTNAELAHMRGENPGVEEQSIADALNMVADKLSAPIEAKTSQKQIRYLRRHLQLAEPTFMERGIRRPGSQDAINSKMSPAQAAHLIMVLVNQKFGGDPSYLQAPDDWDKNYEQKIKNLYVRPPAQQQGDPQQGFQPAEQTQTPRPSQQTPQQQGSQLIVQPAPPVLMDIFNSVNNSISNMSDTDGLKLLYDVFAKMGL
jgi:hypothetical protein